MIKRFFVVAIGLLAWSSSVFAAERSSLAVTWPFLVQLSQDWTLAHEGKPDGVPDDYDWFHKPRIGAGNDPEDFTAFTGWGQAFAPVGGNTALLSVSIRNMQVLLCHGPRREWMLVQQGEIEGAQFRADFEDNINTALVSSSHRAGITSVQFEQGYAYHFWPKQGRVELPSANLCGVLVLLQARTTVPPIQTASGRNGVLIGLGADYWLDQQADWDNYESNGDVGIGRLRWVDANWRWFGMTTASIEDLRNLYMSGYTVAALQK